jgi:hypothetical protein
LPSNTGRMRGDRPSGGCHGTLAQTLTCCSGTCSSPRRQMGCMPVYWHMGIRACPLSWRMLSAAEMNNKKLLKFGIPGVGASAGPRR